MSDAPSASEFAGPSPPERVTLWWCGDCCEFVSGRGHAAWHSGVVAEPIELVYELLPEGEVAP